jgi:dienelactone hydrolase
MSSHHGMRGIVLGTAIVVLLGLVLAAIPAAAQTKVQFDAATLDGGKIRLTGLLDVPEGKGPFPAVVLLHDSSGLAWDLGTANYAAWAERLIHWGYVALRVDSFGPRGVTEVLDLTTVSPRTMSLDAYAARDYLARLPKVGKKPIAVIGWSLGGAGGMYLVDGAYRPSKAKPFQACVCYFPILPTPPTRQDTPLLLLTGEDDLICAASMVRDVESSWAKGSRTFELSIFTYPEATHHFDVPGLNEDLNGVHYEYDPAAAAEVSREVTGAPAHESGFQPFNNALYSFS